MGFHPDWSEISSWIRRSSEIFIKKLARNDVSWADGSGNGHQNGFFVPRPIAESDFFPELKNNNPHKPHIYDAQYRTFWPATGELKLSTIKHFSLRNPGNKEKSRPRFEWQHTGMLKEQFQGLSPASLLLVGKMNEPVADAYYWFMVIDSASEEAELVETAFDLKADFHFGVFSSSEFDAKTETEQFVDELTSAIKDGLLDDFINKYRLSGPQTLAKMAQEQWIRDNSRSDMNPFTMSHPGDAVMRISRDIEYEMYKQAELRFRAAQVAKIVLQGSGDPVENLVNGFSEINSIFLSASQTRKSRAGYSFEFHVERLLKDGGICHEAQKVVSSRRPDFVLPGVKELNENGDAVILSLKTTLRERWKQLALEKPLGLVFLATVDDRVSSEAIDEMQRNDIALVVPEELKKSKESVYGGCGNVITFKQFFDDEVKAKRPFLIISS